MIAVVTLVSAFPLGYLLHSRGTAWLVYLAVYGQAATLQLGYLTRAWVEGDTSAFAAPADPGADYAAVTSAVLAAGFGLVALGHRAGVRSRARRGAADLDPTPS